jgi:hypothetical protein
MQALRKNNVSKLCVRERTESGTSARPLTSEARVQSQEINAGFVLYKQALRQVSL